MSFRLIGAASLTLALLTLACPLQLVAQEAAEASAADSAARITVQIAPPPIAISSAMLGLSGPLGAQPALDKPIYAEFVTEHRQSFTDGNRISRSTNSSIYRDAQGRIRRESQLSFPAYRRDSPPPRSSPSWTTSLATATFWTRRKWSPIAMN